MNKEQLKEMSNAEINELCAVKVMGWEVRGTSTAYFIGPNEIIRTKETTSYGDAWNPVEVMNDAWMLFEKLREKFPWVGIDTFSKGYRCLVIDDDKDHMDGIADTAPLAICKAALLAVMEDEG